MIEIAFAVAHWVYIHITSNQLAAALKSYPVKPYDIRRKQIEEFLGELGWRHRAVFRCLESNEQLDQFCVTTDLSIAIVEPRYLGQFETLNKERHASGLEEFCILIKPRTKVGSGIDISSSEIENGTVLD